MRQDTQSMEEAYSKRDTRPTSGRRNDDGTYIVIEGIDGAGKTTLRRELAGRLDGVNVQTAEPDDEHWTGRVVRRALQTETSPMTDSLLFMADRCEHLNRVVLPMLGQGATVLSDRGSLSTYAYQRERLSRVVDDPWEWLDGVYADWDVAADVTVFVDASPEMAAERMGGDDKHEDFAFLEGVAGNYEELLESGRHTGELVVVDGDRDPGVVADEAEHRVRSVTEGL